MTQYINKEVVIEWVKQRLIPTVTHGNYDDFERGADNERINFLSFINSLPEKPANEDLKEAAKQHSKQTFNGLLIEDNIDAFIAGAEWQKQQMMKNAVDATILDVDAQTIEFGLWPEKLLDIKEGDKVKIVIIKEE